MEFLPAFDGDLLTRFIGIRGFVDTSLPLYALHPGVLPGQVEQFALDLDRHQPHQPAGRGWHGLAQTAVQPHRGVLGYVIVVVPASHPGAFSQKPLRQHLVSTGTFGPGDKWSAVGSIEPIYRTPRGDIFGERHGPIGGPLPEFRAREGFAVSGILIEAPHSIEGLRVILLRTVGDGLDVEDSYASDQYLLILDNATLLSTGGTLAVGLWGWWARDELRGMGMHGMP